MYRSCVFKRSNFTETQCIRFYGISEREKHIDALRQNPELQSKWDKVLQARGQYIEIIGNITDVAVQKYINEQVEESRREDFSSTALQRTSKSACDIALWGEQ